MTTERQEPVEKNSTPARGVTQVGQVFNELERVTRRLPGVAARRARAARSTRPSPSREHITALIEAFPNLRLDPEAPAPFLTGGLEQRGVSGLPVMLT